MNARTIVVMWLLAPVFLQAQASSGSKRASKVDSVYVAAHDAALRRAKVWFEPKTPIAEANLRTAAKADDGFAEDAVVDCTFKIEGVAGSTPKFECELPNGDDIKVKYGHRNAEVYTEVIATRLLSALGFPADRMYPVAQVRCAGCSADPFKDLQCLNEGRSKESCFPAVDHTHIEEFRHAVIERSVDGRRIETAKERGWSWDELVKIDATAGGASRAEVDALRLLAVFLGHWDNKAKNQRLLCEGEKDDSNRVASAEPCKRPIAMVQDVGATFGPLKLDFEKWSATPIWSQPQGCHVSMRKLPYGGSTFRDAAISEEGRQFLASRLSALSPQQVRDLFEGARISEYPHATARGRDVQNWVKAFEAKVEAIAHRAPCPAAAASL